MPLPNNFSPAEHLQDVIKRALNPEVREWFKDVGLEDWDPSLDDDRAHLRVACEHRENDTFDMTLARMQLFYFVVGQAASLQAPIYGIPAQDFQESVKFHPQIKLFFQEDRDRVDEENGFYPVTSEICFRLMEETPQSLTPTKARTYATKIKNIFCANNGFVWKKGKEVWTYIDTHRGYKFQLNVDDEQQARSLINRVLDVRDHTPDWDKYLKDATKRKDLKATSPLPPKELIYGKQRRLPRNKPVAFVRFKYAELHIHGLITPQTLVDRGGTRRGRALVEA